MAKILKGKAALTLARTTDGRVVYVYRGRPAPTNLSDEERTRLVDGEFLEEVEVSKAVADAVAGAAGPGGSGAGPESTGAFDVSTLGTAGIKPTLAWVDGDKGRAEQALAAEQALPVDKQRTSLVASLEKITAESGS